MNLLTLHFVIFCGCISIASSAMNIPPGKIQDDLEQSFVKKTQALGCGICAGALGEEFVAFFVSNPKNPFFNLIRAGAHKECYDLIRPALNNVHNVVESRHTKLRDQNKAFAFAYGMIFFLCVASGYPTIKGFVKDRGIEGLEAIANGVANGM